MRSKGYLIGFTVVLTVVCAALLAGTFEGLKERTLAAKALDKKSKILGAAMDTEGMDSKTKESIYNSRIVSLMLDINGNEIKGVYDETGSVVDSLKDAVDVEKQYKQFLKDGSIPKYFPLYKLRSEVDTTKFESYIIPLYGNGLWDNIWGYVSVGADFNTVTGAVFDHKSETPGLGARITEGNVQSRFIGKKLFKDGKLESVKMLKGEGHDLSNDVDKDYKVDGMAGATMTGNGLNAMLSDYFVAYETFFANSMKNAGSESGSNKIERNDITIDKAKAEIKTETETKVKVEE